MRPNPRLPRRPPNPASLSEKELSVSSLSIVEESDSQSAEESAESDNEDIQARDQLEERFVEGSNESAEAKEDDVDGRENFSDILRKASLFLSATFSPAGGLNSLP